MVENLSDPGERRCDARRWALLGLAIALGIFAPRGVSARPAPTLPEPAPDAVELEGNALVVLWVDGEVAWRPEDRREVQPTPLVIGERLEPGMIIEANAGSRAILLSGGERVATLAGSGRWLIETTRLSSLAQPAPGDRAERGGGLRSPRPQLDQLVGYREGPMAVLEPLASMPLVLDEALPMTLAIIEPSAPVLRSELPELRWHWPFEGGRFDLVLEEVDPGGNEVVRLVERWRNLQAKQLVPWAPLLPGRTYRVTVSLASSAPERSSAGSAPSDSPIVDRQRFHILAPSERSAVDGAIASLDALQKEAKRFRPELDVLKARLLESHGLWAEAEAVWTGLAILYPTRDDVLAHALRLHARSLAADR
jgi:hypothetical protein